MIPENDDDDQNPKKLALNVHSSFMLVSESNDLFGIGQRELDSVLNKQTHSIFKDDENSEDSNQQNQNPDENPINAD
jgi:hypothetical protein